MMDVAELAELHAEYDERPGDIEPGDPQVAALRAQLRALLAELDEAHKRLDWCARLLPVVRLLDQPGLWTVARQYVTELEKLDCPDCQERARQAAEAGA